ncbi:MAG: hypothetical protein IDH49_08795 [Gammaproteobacteria bacterium]|nr:hypothetical protein [Gammaproteobacteria bacterium]
MKALNFTESLIQTFAGRIDHVAYGLVLSWLIGMFLIWTSGSPLNLRTALFGLLGNVFVIAVALSIKMWRNQSK